MSKNNFEFVPGLHYRCIESESYSFTKGCVYPCISAEDGTYLLPDRGSKLRTKTLLSRFELASNLSQPLEELL